VTARTLPRVAEHWPLWQQAPAAELNALGEQVAAGDITPDMYARRALDVLAVAIRAGRCWDLGILEAVWANITTAVGWVEPVPDARPEVYARLRAGDIDPAQARELLHAAKVSTPPEWPTPVRLSGPQVPAFAERVVASVCWERAYRRGYTADRARAVLAEAYRRHVLELITLAPDRVRSGQEKAGRLRAQQAGATEWPPRAPARPAAPVEQRPRRRMAMDVRA
jgi:hypothetical protein